MGSVHGDQPRSQAPSTHTGVRLSRASLGDPGRKVKGLTEAAPRSPPELVLGA